MELLLNFELDVLTAIQSLGATLKPFMVWISFLGTAQFYLAIIPLIYWCIDAALGLRIGIMLMLTSGLNGIFKLAFHTGRPYWVDSSIKAYSAESSFGMPSGHSQNSASLWGLIAAKLQRKWIVAAACVTIFLIGFSRLYLGVHFIHDVLVGWLIGGLLLFAFLKWERPTIAWFIRINLLKKLGVAFVMALTIVFMGILLRAVMVDYQVPAEWSENAIAAAPGVPIDPLNLEGFFTLGGLSLGLVSGVAFLLHGPGLINTQGSLNTRLLCYIVGMVGVVGLYLGLGVLFSRSTDVLGFGLRFLRYALIGLWVSAGAPWLFLKLNLANGKNQIPHQT